ncbi:hypothetical protein F4861DRAFT_305659 [Xylaria intraflava]|nr:hypothetical protein F4861DRAFT_305659 [Xylaria intraflava]
MSTGLPTWPKVLLKLASAYYALSRSSSLLCCCGMLIPSIQTKLHLAWRLLGRPYGRSHRSCGYTGIPTYTQP